MLIYKMINKMLTFLIFNYKIKIVLFKLDITVFISKNWNIVN